VGRKDHSVTVVAQGAEGGEAKRRKYAGDNEGTLKELLVKTTGNADMPQALTQRVAVQVSRILYLLVLGGDAVAMTEKSES
jgi:hypothetical protein